MLQAHRLTRHDVPGSMRDSAKLCKLGTHLAQTQGMLKFLCKTDERVAYCSQLTLQFPRLSIVDVYYWHTALFLSAARSLPLVIWFSLLLPSPPVIKSLWSFKY